MLEEINKQIRRVLLFSFDVKCMVKQGKVFGNRGKFNGRLENFTKQIIVITGPLINLSQKYSKIRNVTHVCFALSFNYGKYLLIINNTFFLVPFTLFAL